MVKDKNKKQLPAKPEKAQTKQPATTSKKVKVVGTQDYLDMTTGELIPMQVMSVEERDFNFTKIWLKNFISTLEMVGNKKTTVAFWIVDNLDRENRLIATTRKIAQETGTSIFTVSTTMKVLQEADFLRMLQSGVYIVNPNVIYKGTHQSRLNVLTQYQSATYVKPELTKAERIKMLRDGIAELSKQLARLEDDAIDVEVDPQLSMDKDGNIYQATKEV